MQELMSSLFIATFQTHSLVVYAGHSALAQHSLLSDGALLAPAGWDNLLPSQVPALLDGASAGVLLAEM